MKTFEEVNTDVNVTYKKLRQIADGILKDATSDVDIIISKINEKSEKLTDAELCTYMLQLSLLAVDLSSYMDHASLRSACADAINEEAKATEFISATGSNEVKRNTASLNTLNESAVVLLYENVAKSLKTKLDEAHRVVDVLKSIQIARNAKAKQDMMLQPRIDEGELNG